MHENESEADIYSLWEDIKKRMTGLSLTALQKALRQPWEEGLLEPRARLIDPITIAPMSIIPQILI